MIYTTCQHLSRYKGISTGLDAAIDYLATADLDKLVLGRNEVAGDLVFVNRFDYTSLPLEQASWEAHKLRIDIQMVLQGEERIAVSDAASLTPTGYDAQRDFLTWDGPAKLWLPMHPGRILILFPEDIHMVKVQLNGPCQVKKAVFKVKV